MKPFHSEISTKVTCSPFNEKPLGLDVRSDQYSPLDLQIGGSHYREGVIQPWDVISDWNLNFWEGNILKYLKRWRLKYNTPEGRIQDLEKMKHYIDYLIAEERRNLDPSD